MEALSAALRGARGLSVEERNLRISPRRPLGPAPILWFEDIRQLSRGHGWWNDLSHATSVLQERLIDPQTTQTV